MVNKLLLSLLCILLQMSIAGQELDFTLEDLCQKSTDIIIGTPLSINSYKSDDGHNVYSLISISVERKFKGNLEKGNIFNLTMFGGTVDGITTYAVGFPKFGLNKKSLFFLNENSVPILQLRGPQRVLFITGLSQVVG